MWHFDSEFIEGDGAYVEIAERLRTLEEGALPIRDILDHEDVAEDNVAWLEFSLDDEPYHWDAAVEDDWADPAIFSKSAKLLADRETDLRFTYLDLGGQGWLIGAATQKQLMCLRSETGLKFVWLE